MAFKMNKEQQAAIDQALVELAARRSGLEDAIKHANNLLADAIEALQGSLEQVNATQEALQEIINEAVSGLRDEFSEKSEKWQDSDVGSKVTDWLDEWANFSESLEPVELPLPGEWEPPEWADIEEIPTSAPRG